LGRQALQRRGVQLAAGPTREIVVMADCRDRADQGDDQGLKLEAYRTALAARNLEINLFWQRSNYFLVLNTAVAVGFFSRTDRDWLALGLSVIGLVISLLWVRLNLGSKFWQTRWERRLGGR
jgi:hypothetical protein